MNRLEYMHSSVRNLQAANKPAKAAAGRRRRRRPRSRQTSAGRRCKHPNCSDTVYSATQRCQRAGASAWKAAVGRRRLAHSHRPFLSAGCEHRDATRLRARMNGASACGATPPQADMRMQAPPGQLGQPSRAPTFPLAPPTHRHGQRDPCSAAQTDAACEGVPSGPCDPRAAAGTLAAP